jgi:hypothetical protein
MGDRESDDEVILYIALGIWGEYAAILPHVYRRAKELGLVKKLGGLLRQSNLHI